jgi:hypothetical protein
VKSLPPQNVLLYWSNHNTFFDEIESLLMQTEGKSSRRAQIKQTMLRLENGEARKGKDYKFLVGFESDALYELRWQFSHLSTNRPARLILSSLEPTISIALLWHIKNPELSADNQRLLQNKACLEAINRKREILG